MRIANTNAGRPAGERSGRACRPAGPFCSPGLLAAVPALLVAALISLPAAADEKPDLDGYLDAIGIAPLEARADGSRPLVIAVVDDGIRTTHEAIRPFLWRNPDEIPGNRIDDDGNGFIDDVNGWDVSDNDADATPPDYRDDFYHGTHVAGVITRMATAAYGERAADVIRIMPVKALADDAPTTQVTHGYRGIEYATAMGADIVLAAWSEAQIGPRQEQILDRAAAAGVLVVGAAGNLAEEKDHYPAAHPAVMAVGSVEANGAKTGNSSYGQFVDLSAPGTDIPAPGIASDSDYAVRTGTSFSAAMAAAAAAMVRHRHPALSWPEVDACLKSTSTPITVEAREIKGKVGAGILDVGGAVDCQVLTAPAAGEQTLRRPKDYLRAKQDRGANMSWHIAPEGEFRGIRFRPVIERKNSDDGRLEFLDAPPPDGRVVASHAVDDLPREIFVPGSKAYVRFEPRRKRRGVDLLIEYEAETIDFRTLFCSGTKRLDTEGVLTDGSADADYSANTDCRWLITAPPGKRILFEFDAIDTEPRTDLIYFFNGAKTNDRIMAIFSGRERPPALTTWDNQVLVWFVTDGRNQGRGFRARYRFVDPPR